MNTASAPHPRRTHLFAISIALALAAGCSGARGAGPIASDGQPAVRHVCERRAAKGTTTSHQFRSRATGAVERYRVYEPVGSAQTSPSRLLVMLHGASADETQWLDVGITAAEDCMVARHEAKPTVIVLVDGSAVERNRSGTVPAMERLVVDEILPPVLATHPGLGGPAETGIGGISLGGGWALQIAADRPDLFGSVGGHSPAGGLDANDRRSLALHGTHVWVDVGRSDPLRSGVVRLARELSAHGVQVLQAHWPGQHDRRYWSLHTEDYLRFYSAGW